MSGLIKMKLKVALIICLAASTMVGCVPYAVAHFVMQTSEGDVFQTPAAQALEPSERAVMEQPDWSFFSEYPKIALEDADCRSNDKWFQQLELVKYARIEVAPGEHRFAYRLGSLRKIQQPECCHFQLTMQPGHVYKPPKEFSNYLCDLLEVIDIAPDGKRLTVPVTCSGYRGY